MGLASLDHFDTHGTVAFEHEASDEGAAADLEVGAGSHRMQVGAGGTEAMPPEDGSVEGREALLAIAVDVIGERIAGLLHGLEERLAEGVCRGTALELERAVAPPPLVGARQARLHPLEVRQAVREVPAAHAGVGAPPLVVERVAPLKDHPVDAARAAKDLSPGVVDAPVVHARLRLRFVPPVVEAIADRERQRSRHVDVHVPRVVRAPGLEHEHSDRSILAQPVGQHAASRTAADNDDVVAQLSTSPMSL